jgi:predicted methyltransferase
MTRTSLLLVALLVACGGKKDDKKEPGPSSGTGSAKKEPGPGTGSAPQGSGSGSAAEATPYKPPDSANVAVKSAIEAKDRTEEDRKLDGGRKPGEILTFFKVLPGQKIGELIAGGGYTTELLARTVGPGGKIWAQNTKDILDRFARKPWTERVERAKDVMKNVVALERPIDDPFPGDVKDLDAVITILNYHDAVWWKADRSKMNKAIFAALKKGGIYGIVDHSAVAGSGTRDVEKLHRIDEAIVKAEVTEAGFKLEEESQVLRNPADKRDWNASPRTAAERRGTSDRFTLRFVKP